MLERECWWSFWILCILSKFVWKKEVLATINSSKIGMIFYLTLLQESNIYVPYSKDLIFCIEIQDILIEDPEHIFLVPWSILIHLSPLSPGRVQFISQTVKIAHRIPNHLFIIHILSFHYFISFWAISTTSFLEQYNTKYIFCSDLHWTCIILQIPFLWFPRAQYAL